MPEARSTPSIGAEGMTAAVDGALPYPKEQRTSVSAAQAAAVKPAKWAAKAPAPLAEDSQVWRQCREFNFEGFSEFEFRSGLQPSAVALSVIFW